MLKIAIKRRKFIESHKKLGRALETPWKSCPMLFSPFSTFSGGLTFKRDKTGYISGDNTSRERKDRTSVQFLGEGEIYLCFFQIVFAARKLAPAQIMVDRCAFVKMLVKSRADSTVKMNLVEIRRFLDWCKRNSEAESYPFSSTVVTLSLFQLFANQHKSHEVLVMVHTALKWFHSFVPIKGPNPLDDACAKNVIESAKRTKGNPIVKKEPISTDLIKKIIDKFAADGASLKDLKIAALCTLGFAGFFRFSELINILREHIVFLEDHIKIFVPHSNTAR